ncbi:MAG: hypothetical protein KC731_05620 [Myxococcales bacterium]|nr:hypothetical protein [Myxococcales bacterium]
MLVIRNDQLDDLEEAHDDAKERSLARHLATCENMSTAEAEDTATEVCALAFEVDIVELEHLVRFARLVRLPGWPDLHGRWGTAILMALARRLADPAARMDFVESELLPRYLQSIA